MTRVTVPVIADVRLSDTRYFIDGKEIAFSAAANPVPAAEGSLVISNSSAPPKYVELLIGTPHQLLKVNTGGATAAWSSFNWDDLATGAGADVTHNHSTAAQGGSLVIGTTDTDATPGSVLFAGAGGVIQQDNANFFYDDAQDYLGLGNAAPAARLHVSAATAAVNPFIVQTTDDDITKNAIELQASTGTVLAAVDPAGRMEINVDGFVGVNQTSVLRVKETRTADAGSGFSAIAASLELENAGALVRTNAGLSFGVRMKPQGNIGNTTYGVTGFGIIRSGSGAVTVSEYRDYDAWFQHSDGDAVLTDLSLFYGRSKVGAGEITNMYGLYLEDIDGGATKNRAIYTNAGDVIFNGGGDAGTDFRVRGDTYTHLLYTDGGLQRVGVNVPAPAAQLDVDQSDNAASIPVLKLNQEDVSEQCIQYSSGGGLDQDFFLWTIDVTGAPTERWDESGDNLSVNKARMIDLAGTGDPADGTLHVQTASAGAVVANAVADDLVVENSDTGGISILTPDDGSLGYLVFGNPADNVSAVVSYTVNTGSSTGIMKVGTHDASGRLDLESGFGVVALSIDSNQNILLAPTATLDLNGIADALILDTDADTTISAPTDDQIDFEIGGADKMVLTATDLRAGNGVGAMSLSIDGAAATLRETYYKTAGSLRWIWRCDNTAEAGGNAGSDFQVRRRADDGTNLGTALFITRLNGHVGINTGAPGAMLHVFQSDNAAGVPVLTLDQADTDVVLAKIIATAAAASVDRTLVADSDFGTPGALAGWIQIEIQDDGNRVADGDYYIPFYAAPS